MPLRETRNGFRPMAVMKAIKKDLFVWACEQHAMNLILDRQTLRKKVLELAKTRGLHGFRCSNRWLTCFLKDYHFSADLINHVSPEIHDYRGWVDLMRSLITKYKHEDLFHADELTMYSDIRPSKTIEYSGDGESPRDRITILMSCNSTGTVKLPLLMCGPYPSEIKVGEHLYRHSTDSYIGDELFKDWLSNVNDRMAKCGRRILLFLRWNRARALKDFVASNNVQLVYLPEDFPPLLRPLRRDVFHYVKMLFRRRYVERAKDYTMEWELSHVMTSLIEAWQTLPRELIVFNFQRTRFRTDDNFLEISYDCWDSAKMGMSFKTFVTFDDDLSNDRVTHETNNRCHSYKLRKHYKNKSIVLIQEKAKTRNYKRTVPALELRNPIDEKLDDKVVVVVKEPKKIRKDKHRNARQSLLKGNPIVRNREERKSLKRTYSRTEFSTQGQSGKWRAFEDENIKNSFQPKERNVGPSTSIKGNLFKEPIPQRHWPEMNIVQVSIQSIVDKALTLMSSAKAECTQKVINNIYASNQETVNDHLTQSERFNEQNSFESKFTNVSEKGANLKSTSTNNSNTSRSEIEQNTRVETTESRAMSFSTFESNKKDHHDVVLREDASRCNRSRENELKTDRNWSKQFETTFVFGSSVTNCSLNHQPDENIVDPCSLNARPFLSPRE